MNILDNSKEKSELTSRQCENLLKILDIHKQVEAMADQELFRYVEAEIWPDMVPNARKNFALSELLTRFAELKDWKFWAQDEIREYQDFIDEANQELANR